METPVNDHQRPHFPREDDGHGHAWGLLGEVPREINERLSPAYEEQLAEIWDELEKDGLRVTLFGAGSEDGEALYAESAEGETMVFLHLEDPNEAEALAAARASGTLRDYCLSSRSWLARCRLVARSAVSWVKGRSGRRGS